MGDTITTMVVIFLAAILLFIFPMIAISERNDSISQQAAYEATVDFVNVACKERQITTNAYDSYVQKLAATGNTYEIELEIKVLDENPGKKSAQTTTDKIGENVYYTIYTSQILEELKSGTKNLKEGDILTVKVKNTNTTISQMFKEFLFTVIKKADAIQVTYSAMVD